MNYGDLIKDAFWITLRNRYPWFFGFFAGVGGSSSSNFNFPTGGGGGFNDNGFDRSGTSACSPDSSRLTIQFPAWKSLPS